MTSDDRSSADPDARIVKWAVGSLGSLRLRGRRREPDIWRWQGQNSYVGAAIAQKIERLAVAGSTARNRGSSLKRPRPARVAGRWR